MEVLDINKFLAFKMDPNTQELDMEILNVLNSLFGSIDKNKKIKKNIKKPVVNILKNQKIQNKKDIDLSISVEIPKYGMYLFECPVSKLTKGLDAVYRVVEA